MNIVIALGLCGAGVAALAWARARTGDFANPAALATAVWCSSFGLFLLRMLPYPEMPLLAAATLLLGASALVGGMLLARPLARHAAPRVWQVPGPAVWIVGYACLGLVGTVWYVWEVGRLLGFQTLLHDATRVRIALANYEIPSRFLFLQFFCMIAPILATALTLGAVRLKAWQWGLVVACAGATWVTTDRTQFFTIVITSLFMFLYRYGGTLSVRRLIGGLVLAGLALTANFLAVGYWTGRSPENLGFVLTAPRPGSGLASGPAAGARAAAALAATPGPRKSPGKLARQPGQPSVPTAPAPLPAAGGAAPAAPPAAPSQLERGTTDAPDALLMQPATPLTRNRFLAAVLRKGSTFYLYATASYAAFALWFPPDQPLTYGVQSAYPVARLLNRVGLISTTLPPQVLGFTKVVRRGTDVILFNGYTFLYYPLRDFGVAGMAAYCLLVGLLIGTVYERTRRMRASALHLVVLGQLTLGIVLSIFVNKFNSTITWYIVFATSLPFWGSALVVRWRAGRLRPDSEAGGDRG